jgi:hypothetical protein
MGDPLDRPRRERNLAWRHFSNLPYRVVRSEAQRAVFEEALVADLQAKAGRYPYDAELRALIEELLAMSSRFRTLWETRNVSFYGEERKIVEHPTLGPLPLDWAILNTQMSNLRVILVTAEAESYSAEAMDRLRAGVYQSVDAPMSVGSIMHLDEVESYRSASDADRALTGTT